MTQRAEIDLSKCVGCGACIQNCPASAIRMLPGFKAAVDPEKCTGCGTCVRLCHKNASHFARNRVKESMISLSA